MKALYVCLVALVLGWNCCYADVQSVAFTFSETPSVGGFFSIFCEATVPGVEADSVVVAIAGPGGSPQPIGVRDNDVFRRVLLFFSLAESNSGVYTCQVMVDGTTIRIVTAAMDVSAGTFLHTSVELSPNPVQVGMDVTFTCTATIEGSTDPATFQWTESDGNAVTTSDEVIISSGSNSSTLQFSPAHESQAGEYNCEAVVLSLSATNSAQLEVTAGTFLNTSVELSSNPVQVGMDVTFTCTATTEGSTGPATFQWTDSDGNVVTTSDEVLISSEGNSSTLQFSPAHESQAGKYNCEVVVLSLSALSSAQLEVTVPDISLVITSSGTPVVGEDYFFICTVTNTRGIGAVISIGIVIDGDSSMLMPLPVTSFLLPLSPLTLSDAGIYQCSVEVDSPYITNTIALMTAPEEQTIRVTIPTPSVEVTIDTPIPVQHLSSPTLTCSVDVSAIDVDVSISWAWTGPDTGVVTFPITGITPTAANETAFENTVMLSDLAVGHGNGDYSCIITILSVQLAEFITDSEAGSDMIFVDVRAFVSPSAPSITEQVLQEGQVSLNWTQLPIDIVDSYAISVSTSPVGCEADVETMAALLNGSERTFRTNDLEEFSEITITVSAQNEIGNTSTVVVITTLSADPDGMPQALVMESSTASSIAISWGRVECLQRNSEITGYVITLGRSTGDDRIARQVLEDEMTVNIAGTDTDSRRFNATGLQPRSIYTFSVMAVNSEGQGPPIVSTFETSVPTEVGVLFKGHLVPNNSIVTINNIGEGFSELVCLTNDENCCDSSSGGRWLFPNDSVVPASGDVYEGRGPSFLSLNSGSGVEVDNGLFRCEIPNTEGVDTTSYIGIYSTDLGTLTVQTLDYNASTSVLTCVSTGGPATEVEWQRNGVTETSFPRSQRVSNTVTSTYTNTLLLNGEPETVIGDYRCTVSNIRGTMTSSLITLRGLQVTGFSASYNDGDDLSVTCSTDLKFSRIVWLLDDGVTEMSSTDSESQLILSFPGVSSDLDQRQFTCRVESELGNQDMTIIINVQEPVDSVAAIVGGVVGGIAFLLLVLFLIFILIWCCLGSRARSNHLNKTNPTHYELGVFRPTIQPEDDDGNFPEGYDARDAATSQTGLTEHQGNRWNGLSNGTDGVDDVQTTFVNEDAIYVNSTFRARDRDEPIPVAEFESHVQQLHAGKNFETEYLSISRSPQSSYDVSCIPFNKIRNRFANIFPYDDNRVVLKSITGIKGSDYINASFVDGYKKEKAYIASQGPNPESLSDFWRMIWEYRIPTIAMLTRCYEGGKKKCVQYFPEKLEDPVYPGQNLSISLTSIMTFANYTVRKMSVRNTAEPDSPPLEVVHYHFLGWPDHGVPTNAMSLISFIKQIRKSHPLSSSCYLLVHCSAGVGRTGTFITLDSMLERRNAEDNIAVYPFVKHIRTQRVLMVQTLVQYTFIFDALNEYIICGETELNTSNIRETVSKLSEVVSKEEDFTCTGFEQQYMLLNHMTYVIPEARYGHAKAPYNEVKNRYPNRIPNYFTRVRLRPTALEGSDYINASFIDGYKRTQAFIATQGPLKSTMEDFWKMIYEYRSKCIVMLCSLEEDGEENSCLYWPTTNFDSVLYGKITVTKTVEKEFPEYVMRKFEITGVPAKCLSAGSQLSPSFVVTHFQYLSWPESKPPKDSNAMIEMIEKVNKVQMSTGDKSITVMCNNGVGRTGTFIAIHTQLERFKTEKEADLFQYIKSTRLQRAGMVLDAAQYKFCHQVLVDYLDSFDEYDNFKN